LALLVRRVPRFLLLAWLFPPVFLYSVGSEMLIWYVSLLEVHSGRVGGAWYFAAKSSGKYN
jgi:hypothetical protein